MFNKDQQRRKYWKTVSKERGASTMEHLRNLRYYFLVLKVMLDEISTKSKYKTLRFSY